MNYARYLTGTSLRLHAGRRNGWQPEAPKHLREPRQPKPRRPPSDATPPPKSKSPPGAAWEKGHDDDRHFEGGGFYTGC